MTKGVGDIEDQLLSLLEGIQRARTGGLNDATVPMAMVSKQCRTYVSEQYRTMKPTECLEPGAVALLPVAVVDRFLEFIVGLIALLNLLSVADRSS